VSDVIISEFIAFYRAGGTWATVTVIEPPGRFGIMHIEENNNKVKSSVKKMPRRGADQCGFLRLRATNLRLIDDDATVSGADTYAASGQTKAIARLGDKGL
jgi:glucose-1-phosphate cytidylyltransferase